MPLCFRGLLARCAPRETALIRASWPGPADQASWHRYSGPGAGQKFNTRAWPRDEHDVVAGVSGAGGAIWRTAHSRAHTVPFLSHSLARSRSSSSPSLTFFHPCSISPPFVFVSLPVSVSFSSAGSFVHRGGPQARQR